MIFIHLVILAISMILGFVFSYLAIMEEDLLKAVIYSAGQGVMFSIAFYILMAPDVLLAYIAIAIGIYTALLVFVISKTERKEVV
ncbi:MAG: DUF4040 domain-containing protein [Euryarchaeota archaeon]|nr:DUF4040 domain-containing protein [Euryarchaeota archaeon]MCD6158233.1 DUF4040 domain-containing protein [Euryarchaeota archaeon]RLF67522.1 MAG: sodium:proton antiporter [Thermoplasmata archaeon]